MKVIIGNAYICNQIIRAEIYIQFNLFISITVLFQIFELLKCWWFILYSVDSWMFSKLLRFIVDLSDFFHSLFFCYFINFTFCIYPSHCFYAMLKQLPKKKYQSILYWYLEKMKKKDQFICSVTYLNYGELWLSLLLCLQLATLALLGTCELRTIHLF